MSDNSKIKDFLKQLEKPQTKNERFKNKIMSAAIMLHNDLMGDVIITDSYCPNCNLKLSWLNQETLITKCRRCNTNWKLELNITKIND